MWHRLQEFLDLGVVAVLHQKLGPVALPHHLLQIGQIPLMDPYPDVGLLEVEACDEILHVNASRRGCYLREHRRTMSV